MAVVTFLFGVALGLGILHAIREIGGWLDKPTLQVENRTVRLWHRGGVIELTPDAARKLADYLVRRANEVETRRG